MSRRLFHADPAAEAAETETAGRRGRSAMEVDEVAAAKARLLAASESSAADPAAKLNDLLRDHPYLVSAAAVGAGLLVTRVRVLRKVATVGGMWAAKRYLMRYLQRMAR